MVPYFVIVVGDLFVKIDSKSLKYVIKHYQRVGKFVEIEKSRTFATVFFIVLDLRLTKVGVQRYSFFFVYALRLFVACFKNVCHIESVMQLKFISHILDWSR